MTTDTVGNTPTEQNSSSILNWEQLMMAAETIQYPQVRIMRQNDGWMLWDTAKAKFLSDRDGPVVFVDLVRAIRAAIGIGWLK